MLTTNQPIDPGEGSFSWTPTAAEGSGVYALTFRVTDNGSPNLIDEETIQVTVTNPGSVQITGVTLSSPGSITLELVPEPARTY